MVPSNAAPAKVCVSCQVDVTNAPRMKDPQGRYFCQACASKATKTSSSKPISVVAPAVSGNQDFMAKIIDEAAEKASHTCPSCQHPIAPDAKLCTGCGFNLANGKKVMTKVTRDMTKEKNVGSTETKSRQMPTWALWLLESNSAIVILIAAPAVVTFTLAMLVPELVLVHLALAGLLFFVCTIWAIKDGFEDSAVNGWLLLLSSLGTIFGFFGFGYVRLSFVWVIVYGLFITDNSRLKIAWASYLFAIITAVYILFTNADVLGK